MAQALLFINGELINRKVSSDGGLVDRSIKAGKSDSDLLDELYWTALGRAPRPAERVSSLASIQKASIVSPPPAAAPTLPTKTSTGGTTLSGAVASVTAPAKPAGDTPATMANSAPAVADQKILAATARRHAFEDMFWVLLNSKEFLFNH